MSTDRLRNIEPYVETHQQMIDGAVLAVKRHLEVRDVLMFPMRDFAEKAAAYMFFDSRKIVTRPFVLAGKLPIDSMEKTTLDYWRFTNPILEYIHSLGEYDTGRVYPFYHPSKGRITIRMMPMDTTQFSKTIDGVYSAIYGKIDCVYQAEVECLDHPEFFKNHKMFYQHLN